MMPADRATRTAAAKAPSRFTFTPRGRRSRGSGSWVGGGGTSRRFALCNTCLWRSCATGNHHPEIDRCARSTSRVWPPSRTNCHHSARPKRTLRGVQTSFGTGPRQMRPWRTFAGSCRHIPKPRCGCSDRPSQAASPPTSTCFSFTVAPARCGCRRALEGRGCEVVMLSESDVVGAVRLSRAAAPRPVGECAARVVSSAPRTEPKGSVLPHVPMRCEDDPGASVDACGPRGVALGRAHGKVRCCAQSRHTSRQPGAGSRPP